MEQRVEKYYFLKLLATLPIVKFSIFLEYLMALRLNKIKKINKK